jgi:Phosphotransferase enzyme family
MEVSSLPSPPLDDGDADPRLESTVAAVNWNTLASLACSIHCATSSRWGDQLSGGYNVVRFLHLDDANHSALVVRVPYRPAVGWTEQYIKAFASQMSSEVATMRYLATHTTISVPRIIDHSVEADGGGVGSPYMIMTKIDGVPLSSVWNDMEDAKRENVLRQVVDILLELASQRFDKIGTLLQREGDRDSTAKEAWYVAPMVRSPDDTSVAKAIPSITFTGTIDCWVAYADANLESIRNSNFGSETKIYQYGHAWFMRSLVPALYNPSLDVTGFPLCPGDFHSQNIMIVAADTSPRIQVAGVIDWEFSGTHGTSSFAQHPLFIVDHPQWEDDNPLRPRSVRDQVTFNVFMREAEMKKDPIGDFPSLCELVYLFE